MNSSFYIINSADRLSGSVSDFAITINPAIQKANKLELSFVTIPNTIYNISSSNNIFYLTIGATDYDIVITPGSYNTSTLSSALAAAILAATGIVFTITYNSITYKMTIASAGVFDLRLSLRTSSIWNALGFKSTTNLTGLNTYTSDSAIYLGPDPFYLLQIDLIPSRVYTTSNSYASYVISNNANPDGSINYWTINSTYHIAESISCNIFRMNVRLNKSDGTPVDLNGSEWTFGLYNSI